MVTKRKLIQYFGLAVAVILLLCGILNAPNLRLASRESPRAPDEPAIAVPVNELRVPLQARSGLPAMKDPLGALYATTMIKDSPIWLETHMSHGDHIVSCLFNLPTFGTCIKPEPGPQPGEVFSNLQALTNAGQHVHSEPPPGERRAGAAPGQPVSDASAEHPAEAAIGGYDPSSPVIATKTAGQVGAPGTEVPATIPPVLSGTSPPITTVSLSGAPVIWNATNSGGIVSSSTSSQPSSPGQAQSPASQDPASTDGSVPEPATTGMMILLLGCGLAGRWKFKRSNSS